MATEPSTAADVRAANRAFYSAFEARDLEAITKVWEHSDRVLCTHPGWATLRGWPSVLASFYALFEGPRPVQFILTDEQVEVAGDTAWVTLDENILGDEVGGTVAALNLFAREGNRWLLVAHHASLVAASAALDGGEA